MKYDYRIMTVMSDRHQKEHLVLSQLQSHHHNEKTAIILPAVTSRMIWLEYQTKLRVESILELCRTGK